MFFVETRPRSNSRIFLSRSKLRLLILLLLGLVLLFAYHLFLNLVLILFPAFVSHCVTPFRSLFTVLPNVTSPFIRDNTLSEFKAIPAPTEVNTEKQ